MNPETRSVLLAIARDLKRWAEWHEERSPDYSHTAAAHAYGTARSRILREIKKADALARAERTP